MVWVTIADGTTAASDNCQTTLGKREEKLHKLNLSRASPLSEGFFLGVEMSFLCYRGGRSLLFGIEIFVLASRFCILFSASRLSSSWDQPVRVLWPRHSVTWRPKRSRCRKEDQIISIPKNISIPTKR